MKLLTTLVSLSILLSSAHAEPFPKPIESAFEAALATQNIKTSFSLRLTTPNSSPITFRYNAAENSWSVQEGNFEELTKGLRQSVKQIQEDLSQPGALSYESMQDELRVHRLLEENQTHLIYEVSLHEDEDGMPKAMREALSMTLHITKDPLIISSFRMHSDAPFKPAPIAKINTLEIYQEFDTPEGFEAPLLKKYHNEISGSAMMKKFHEEFTVELFNFVPEK